MVGVPSELSEEEIKAFVVVRDGAADLAAVRERAAGRLTPFKVPRYIEAVDRAAPHRPPAGWPSTGCPRAHRRRGDFGMRDDDWLRTGIGTSTPTRSRSWAATWPRADGQRHLHRARVPARAAAMPDAGEARLLDAVLVSLADHGLTPTVLAARLTYTGAPESLQGAVAAGPAGRRQRLPGRGRGHGAVPRRDRRPTSRRRAARWRDAHRGRASASPGLGHPIHKVEDPRTPRIYAIAEETGAARPHLRALREVAAAHAEQTGRALPINGAGVAGRGAGRPRLPAPRSLRGFALLARTAGLLGHLAEEMQSPIGMRLYREVDERAKYVPPTGE